MSLFRKPKRIQRRVFCVDDDEDGELDPPPPPVISHGRKENKPLKTTSLLSFADEEEDGEVFIVKKSSQSKRLAKRRDREKRRANDSDPNKYPINNLNNEEKDTSISSDNQEKPKKKKVSLEGLILTGRAALAAEGTGDVSGSEEEGPVEEDAAEDNRGFHQYRAESVRAALAVAPGPIPDAALIHAARKTRQQAREHGDFIPVGAEPAPGGRLQRDDGSGDDDDEGRIHVRGLDLPTDKPERGTAAASPDSELDSEGEGWAEQQMQKARLAVTDASDAGAGETNPFAVAPPPPRMQEPPAHLRPLAAHARAPPATPAALFDALADRLNELEAARSGTAARLHTSRARLAAAASARAARAARRGALDAAYRRSQAARGFLTDLVECLDEKMPQLEALEARALALHRRRCSFLSERRRADLQDQALDTLASTGRGGSAKGAESEEKIRRTAEREGRRRARRLRREAAAAAAGAPRTHRDGDSSDDELPPNEEHHYRQEKECIRAACASLFADALPAWRSARGVCAQLARWRRRDPALYADAYVADCLPKLLAPYVRHQLVLWNPLADEDNEDYERMDWYSCLMMYGVRKERLSSESSQSSEEDCEPPAVSEEAVRADPDLMLVPAVINGVVLPKLAELVECAWDPMCVRACVRLRQLVVRACALPGSAAAVARLAAAARARLALALSADVFLPPLPHTQAMEGASGMFWRRCLGSGVRLLRAALALTAPPPLLRADDVAISLIDTLSTAAGAAPGPAAAMAAAALAETVPRGAGSLRARALRRLAALAQLAARRLDPANPLHMKALEQAKAVITEARLAE